MITYSKLGNMGRLGNQLFQISSTIGIAKKNNEDYGFPEWQYGKYFKNKIPVARNFPTSLYQERGFHYNSVQVKNTDLVGYFQSEKYFKDHSNVILNYFEFNFDTPVDYDISSFCSVHVRRTDYLSFPDYHPFPGMEYYNRSISYMRERGISNFIIFSDDIDWCKQNFGSDFKYSEGLSDIQDLCLMSKCGSHIIANSSFSWWGAWLNKKNNKIVIAPSVWFGSAKSNTITEDLYCENWIKL